MFKNYICPPARKYICVVARKTRDVHCVFVPDELTNNNISDNIHDNNNNNSINSQKSRYHLAQDGATGEIEHLEFGV